VGSPFRDELDEFFMDLVSVRPAQEMNAALAWNQSRLHRVREQLDVLLSLGKTEDDIVRTLK
jgi:hypothetical protein